MNKSGSTPWKLGPDIPGLNEKDIAIDMEFKCQTLENSYCEKTNNALNTPAKAVEFPS
ncbi:hypothetical protein CROQUDRAFT_95440 [Cronartium quercuum f. sp. fusiforme G11]|uniref:Uncharacterized protein n=1 Tax=Cronartium quercuum f. sp. fusiforme G11 TaxID=708437 RepID=A0A9P6NHB6_9BASI|nr:hypothetical protein CROQUDRAFT_95440 [Cronartium quercuum f. sp. fusiforme G11]